MRGQTWRLPLQYLKSLLRFFGRSILNPSLYPQIVMDFFFFCSILFHLSRPTTYQKESRNPFAMPMTILNGVRHIYAVWTHALPEWPKAIEGDWAMCRKRRGPGSSPGIPAIKNPHPVRYRPFSAFFLMPRSTPASSPSSSSSSSSSPLRLHLRALCTCALFKKILI